MLTFNEALSNILSTVKPAVDVELLPLKQCLNRISASDIFAPLALPQYRNSAMDGFAVCDLGVGRIYLKIIGTSSAGHPFEGKLSAGTAVRIFTGAVLPEGADTVIMQEHAEYDETTVRVLKSGRQGANIRHPGEDVEQGACVAAKGARLTPGHIGLLAALGISAVWVFRLPRVALFSTGDELQPLGSFLKPGQLYDSNHYAIYSLVKELGIELQDGGVIPDDKNKIKAYLNAVSEEVDMIITSGGVSVGDADDVKTVLAELGEVHFWKVAIKPGKPLVFGKIKQSYFFGLPGNPVSAMVTFDQFVKPALCHLMGQTFTEPLTFNATLVSTIKKEPGRRDFQRGVLTKEKGEWLVASTGTQSSGALSSMARANCYIVLSEESESVERGALIEVQPF